MKEFFDYVLGCEENVNRKSEGVYMGKRRIKIMIPKEKKKGVLIKSTEGVSPPIPLRQKEMR